MASIWERDGKMPAYPAIDADRRTETLVIGGGMTGLLCGHFLREQNGEYLILEKDRDVYKRQVLPEVDPEAADGPVQIRVLVL